jgi:glycosyltransferase involved in cell wall biosynthesis
LPIARRLAWLAARRVEMRVCLVSQEYPPETASGGIGAQTYLKAHGLARLGHEVVVISASPDVRHAERQDGPVRVVRIAGYDDRMPLNTELARWLTYGAEVAAALATLHALTPFDIVDFPDWGSEGYVHLLNRAEWATIPTVIQLHGPLVMFAHAMGWPELNSELYRVAVEMEGTCLRLADAVFSSSACSADWCARYYGLARERIPVLHTGVDIRLFHPDAGPKDERPTIVFVGRVQPAKGADLLVDAACELAQAYQGLQLRLIGLGEPEFVQQLRARAAACGRPGLLDCPGFVATSELPAQLSRAHVFAGPSIYEPGPGFVYLEAMACGLPVVACETGGAAEAVRHQETGFLVPPQDAGALAAALRRLLASPELRKQMGDRGRLVVEAEADSEVCLRRLETFYQTVVDGGP